MAILKPDKTTTLGGVTVNVMVGYSVRKNEEKRGKPCMDLRRNSR